MKEWIDRFGYGNGDISGGIELFWLQGSMRVSAFEQVEFLRKLEEGRLPVSARSRRPPLPRPYRNLRQVQPNPHGCSTDARRCHPAGRSR